jgi:hypothetical protein
MLPFLWKINFLWQDEDSPIIPTRQGAPLYVVAHTLTETLSVIPSVAASARIKIEVISVESLQQVHIVPTAPTGAAKA